MIAGRRLACRSAAARSCAASASRRRPGEVTAIVGPNGSGKTTLLRALPASSAYVGQRHARRRRRSPRAHGLAAAPRCAPCCRRRRALAFPFTVREVVRLGLARPRRRRRPARGPAADARWHASTSRASPAASTRSCPAASSSACSWPACSARSGRRCSTGEPRWLLLDEPVSSLDIEPPAHRHADRPRLRPARRRRGRHPARPQPDRDVRRPRRSLLDGGRVAAAGAACRGADRRPADRRLPCAAARQPHPPAGQVFVLPQAAAG